MLKIQRCPNCGSTSFNEKNGKVFCAYCGATFSVERYSFLDDNITVKYNRAVELRSEMRFDDSIRVLDSLISKMPNCAELYYQLLLARLGVSFVEDKGKTKVTVSRLSTMPIFDQKEAVMTLKYAEPHLKSEYEETFESIEEIRSEAIKVSKEVKPYDVFISFKQHPDDNNKTFTQDYEVAREIYEDLTKKGVRVFFSPVSLTAGTNYEPYIYRALQTSKVMLVVAATPEEDYLESPWVRNEWSRFYSLTEHNENKRVLIPVLAHGFRPDYLPALLATKQAIAYDGSFWKKIQPVLKQYGVLQEKKEAVPVAGFAKRRTLIIGAIVVGLSLTAAGIAVPVAISASKKPSNTTIIYNNGSQVTSQFIPVTSATLLPEAGFCINVGKNQNLSVNRLPSNATETMDLHIKDESIATYLGSGVVQGAKGGTTKIWATAKTKNVKSNEVDCYVYELDYETTKTGFENNNANNEIIERVDVTSCSLYFGSRSKTSTSRMQLYYDLTLQKTYQDTSSTQSKFGLKFRVYDADDNKIGDSELIKSQAFSQGTSTTLSGYVAIEGTQTLNGGVYKLEYIGIKWTDVY